MSDHSGFSSLGNHIGDLFSGGAALLALLGRLFGFLGDGITYAGALAALIWFCIQIWRSREIQHWWNNRMQVHWAKKLVRVRQQEKIAVAKIEALAQVRGELPGTNVMFGLPDKLYGYPVVVETTYYVSTMKGVSTVRTAVLPAATPFMCARPGGLVGVADAPTFATGVIWEYEAMTAEVIKDTNNRRQLARVVDDIGTDVVAPASGVLFQNAG